MRSILGLLAGVLAAGPAFAGFGQWSVDIKDDPFDKKGRLVIAIMDSRETGVLIMCEQDSGKIILRRASMFPYDQASPPAEVVTVRLIVDEGEEHLGFGATTMLGTGNIGVDMEREADSARRLLTELREGKKALYLKIGEAEAEAFKLRGSTKVAEQALDYCF
ncbi:hypothetical protein [Rhizobium rhizophilum]|uniref:Uncharacterized protein n=1 Tax=Rhizobium rhizophilum TaxID=1850373 RepID=A0ABY2QT30_9HYPH|nr:hypothetical protein [Rhizobium rhizophilum]THV13751.1 hypothetical protein E9677_12650 [Rhizobium rhizophilum]